MIRPLRAALAATSAAALLVALATPASAHIGTSPSEVPAGRSALVQFQISHGCEGSPTTRVEMQIPDGVVSVSPEVVPGWQIETTVGPITPFDNHGTTVEEGVKTITWSGGSLPDDRVQRFGVSMRLPDSPGDTVSFPVVQTCATGEHRWIDVAEPGEPEPESPAPSVLLVAAGGDGHSHGATAPGAGGAGSDEAVTDEGEASGGEAAVNGAGEDGAEAGAGSGEVAAALGEGDGDGTGLAAVALVVGGLGLVVGIAGVVLATRRQPGSPRRA